MSSKTSIHEPLRPTRRTMVRSAAWTVPVVAVAATAPAYATSACRDGQYRIRWASEYNSSTKKATANRTSTSGSGTLGNADLTLTITNEFGGSMGAGSANPNLGESNLTATTYNVAGVGAPGLTIMQRVTTGTTWWNNSLRYALPEPRSGNFQRVTLTFNRPVWDLKFTITDIDSNDGQYQDRVFVSGNPTYTVNSGISGDGSSGTPWRPVDDDQNWDPQTQSNGNVTVDYAGKPSASVYTITYWNDQTGNLSGNGLQGVFLGTLTFGAETCP
jgi:hypothetical protein